jgi:methyl-accepting chemotaxis protein
MSLLSLIRNSLQKKLILLFVLIATLPLLAASYFSFISSKNTLIEEIKHSNLQAATGVARELDIMIDARLKLLQTISKDNDIASMNPARMVANVKAAAGQFADMSTVIVSDNTGKQVYRNIGTLGNISDRQYFQDIKNGQPYSISDVLFAKATGKSSIVISVPLRDSTGQWVGLVSGVMDLQYLSNAIAQHKIGETGYAFVVDKNGQILAHPNAEYVTQQKVVTELEPVQKAITANVGVAFYTWENAKKVAGYSFVPLTRWGVIVQMSEAEALAGAQKIKIASLVTAGIAVVLACMVGIYIARVLTRPINEIVQGSQTIAAGNLTYTVTIDSQDEIGQLADSFNTMVTNLRNVVKRVVSNSQTVAASAEQLSASASESSRAVEQIAETAGQLAAGAQNQSREVATTARTVGELARSAQEVAEKAESAACLAQDVVTAARAGSTSVRKAVEQMQEIDSAVAHTSTIVKELGLQSKEIGNIVEVITGIAGQTNLLALNAAIEAARAGEQGRGFAVVADEVRKLAEQSQVAAQQIADIIGQIQVQTDTAVSAMENGTRKVAEGVYVAQEAGKSIEGILSKVSESVSMIESISAAAEEQAAATGEVVKSIDSIAAIAEQSNAGAQTAAAATEETTASMEEIAASSQALAQAAAELEEMVQKFKV